jgi:hypothetical protein
MEPTRRHERQPVTRINEFSVKSTYRFPSSKPWEEIALIASKILSMFPVSLL